MEAGHGNDGELAGFTFHEGQGAFIARLARGSESAKMLSISSRSSVAILGTIVSNYGGSQNPTDPIPSPIVAIAAGRRLSASAGALAGKVQS